MDEYYYRRFFHRADGSRKKVSANGFQRIKRLDETENESI